jgi:hypothetical protein
MAEAPVLQSLLTHSEAKLAGQLDQGQGVAQQEAALCLYEDNMPLKWHNDGNRKAMRQVR